MEDKKLSAQKPVNQVTAIVGDGIPGMSEPELTEAMASVEKKWGPGVAIIRQRSGNSPYSSESVLIVKHGKHPARGERLLLAPLGSSYNGSGHYKGRGRWRTVWLAREAECKTPEEKVLVVCHEDDPNSVRLGCLNVWLQDVESWRASEAVGRNAVALAFEKLGL